jgi:hypothetical protein
MNEYVFVSFDPTRPKRTFARMKENDNKIKSVYI